MDENRYYYKQNTYTSNASDDSSYTFPIPWITDTRKRKSRLGKHRVLQDLVNQNQEPIETNESVENKPAKCEEIKETRQPDSPKTYLNLDFPEVKALPQNSFLQPSLSHDYNFTSFLDLNNEPYPQPLSLPRVLSFQDISVTKPDSQDSFANANSPNDLKSNSGNSLYNFKSDSGSTPKPFEISNAQNSAKTENSVVSSSNVESIKSEILENSEFLGSNYDSCKSDVKSKADDLPQISRTKDLTPKNESCPSNEKNSSSSNEKRVEFKQPENVPVPKEKNDFQFEAPLPVPLNPKSSEHLPPYITIKGKTYKVVNILGSGGSSMVYQVLHPENNDTLAVKKVILSEVDESIAEGYIDEVKVLKNLQKSEFIIKMFDHELVYEGDKKLLYVVMEKGDTDLSELIRNINKTKKLSILMILYYWHEMLSAVQEIHNEGIIHSDLKPANFLLVKGRLKLIDFGIASSIQGDMTSVYKDVFTGTLNYMSPEAVQYVNCSGSMGYKITYKTDVWSLGCILYNLIYGQLPFQHIRKKWEKMRSIVDPKVPIHFPEVKGVPSVLMEALKSCLDKDPKKRMSVSQLLKLPYCGN